MILALLLSLAFATPEIETIPHRDREYKQIYLEKEAAHAYREMAAAAAKDGIELIPISGYRSPREQKYLYNKYGPIRAAPPGASNHELGLAVDFSGVERFITNDKINTSVMNKIEKVCRPEGFKGWICPTITYWWLYQNAQKFGFVQTIDFELWHWKFDKSLYKAKSE
jgi:D-alanyl-D-alanine carboxypeptidase